MNLVSFMVPIIMGIGVALAAGLVASADGYYLDVDDDEAFNLAYNSLNSHTFNIDEFNFGPGKAPLPLFAFFTKLTTSACTYTDCIHF